MAENLDMENQANDNIRQDQSKCCVKMPSLKKFQKEDKGLHALASGSLVLTQFHPILSRTEKRLEEELKRERQKQSSRIGRLKQKGIKLVESKPVLFCIVLLNMIDCVLVLGELILDMYFIKGLIDTSQAVTAQFITDIKTSYPNQLSFISNDDDITTLYRQILRAKIEWNIHMNPNRHRRASITSGSQENASCLTDLKGTLGYKNKKGHTNRAINSRNKRQSMRNVKISNYDVNTTQLTENVNDTALSFRNHTNDTRNKTGNFEVPGNGGGQSQHDDTLNHDHGHSGHLHTWEVELTHAFHKTSIAILVVLLAEGCFKIFFYGRTFLHRKLEIFDFVIVIGSLIVDMVLFEGISAYEVEWFVIILAFLMPWRVIRVLNSLVVAVIDHEHFRLKLLYKQKKAVLNELKRTKIDLHVLQVSLENIKQLTREAGVSEECIMNKMETKIKEDQKPTFFEDICAKCRDVGSDVLKKSSTVAGGIAGFMRQDPTTADPGNDGHTRFSFTKSFPFLHHNTPTLNRSQSEGCHGGLTVDHSFPFIHRYPSKDKSSGDIPSNLRYKENPEQEGSSRKCTGLEVEVELDEDGPVL